MTNYTIKINLVWQMPILQYLLTWQYDYLLDSHMDRISNILSFAAFIFISESIFNTIIFVYTSLWNSFLKNFCLSFWWWLPSLVVYIIILWISESVKVKNFPFLQLQWIKLNQHLYFNRGLDSMDNKRKK